MSRHELIVGRPGSLLENALADKIMSLKGDDPLRPVVVLVGAHLPGTYLARNLARRGKPHANLRFLTFAKLADVLASGDSRPPCPEGASAALAVDVVRSARDLEYLAPIADFPGFPGAFHSALVETLYAGFDPIRLAENPDVLADLDPADRSRLGEFFALAARHESLVNDRFLTPHGALRAAAERAGRFPGLFGAEEMIVYGFYDLNRLQLRLIEALANAIDLSIFFPCSEAPGWDYARGLFEFFSGLVDETTFLEDSDNHSTDLQILKKRLFAREFDLPREPGDGSFTVIDAAGEVSEAGEIAREILRLVSEDGFAFHEIGVLLRSGDPYLALLSEVFDESGIPYHAVGGLPLTRTTAGRAFAVLAGLANRRFTRRELMDFLLDAPVVSGDEMGFRARLDLWDLFTRNAGIVDHASDWDGRLAALKIDDSQEKEHLASLKKFLSGLFERLEIFQKKNSWSGFSKSFLELTSWLFDETCLGFEEAAACVESLADLDEVTGKVAPGDFFNTLEKSLDGASLKKGSYETSGVTVSSIMEARGVSFRAVFLAGLTDGAFPARPGRDSILLEENRKALNKKIPCGEYPLHSKRALEEEILFAMAVESARERLCITFPRLDADTGRPRNPSYFVKYALDTVAGRRFRFEEFARHPCLRAVGVGRLAPEERDRALAPWEFDLSVVQAAYAGRIEKNSLSYMESSNPLFGDAVRLVRARWKTPGFTEWDGLVGDFSRALPDDAVSPTFLETYARCPFLWFVRYGLGLRELEDPLPASTLDALARGNFFHDAARDAYVELGQRGLLPLSKANAERAAGVAGKIAERAAKRLKRESPGVPPVFLEIEASALVEALKRLVVNEAELDAPAPDGSRWKPFFFEKPFGPRGGGVEIETESGGRVSLAGRIDRLDVSENGRHVRVLDYKTGKKPTKIEGFLGGGLWMQRIVYFLAAEKLANDLDSGDPPEVAESGYYYVNKSLKTKLPIFPILAGQRAEFEESFRAAASTVLGGVSRGEFFHYPGGKNDNCAYCPCAPVCGVSTDRLFEIKMQDPVAAEFIALKEEP